jgi:parallel beta-helix repeat protein
MIEMRGKGKTSIAMFLVSISIIQSMVIISSAETEHNPITTSKNIRLTPLDDIQTALNSADPYDIITLIPGTYNQTLTIRCPLTITALDPTNTIIHATSQPNQAVITINAEEVNINNITVINEASGLYSTGIRVLKGKAHIDNCIIKNTPVGIALWTSQNTISNSYFYHCDDEGIVLLNTTYAHCSYNKIIHCRFLYNCDAIEMQGSTHTMILNCTMKYNTHSGIDGIKQGNNHNFIYHCTIRDNRVHGIYLSQSSNNLVISCAFHNNTDGDIIESTNTSNTIITNLTTHLEQDSSNSLQSSYRNMLVSLIQERLHNIRSVFVSTIQIIKGQ